MEMIVDRVEADLGGAAVVVRVDGSGAVMAGPLEVNLDIQGGGATSPLSVEWSVANAGGAMASVRSVALVLRLVEAVEPVRMFTHGYQSWSRSGVSVFGVDGDPSAASGSIEFVRAMHHADQRRARDDELRSEWVTVLRDAAGDQALAGFVAGVEHDGTWRLRRGATGGLELWAEAFLGGAALAPGEKRGLHRFVVEPGGAASDATSAAEQLEAWAAWAGSVADARVDAPYQVGWCSWYHYFGAVTEADLRSNLALAADWPFDVFQLDDGFQRTIGDWLDTNDKFASTLDGLAAAVAAAGRRPGLWLAPFIVAPDSQVARDHPGWLARTSDGGPLFGMLNPEWGGGEGGLMYALDTTHPDVVAHLEHVARSLVDAGFTYLKLDFTFAPSLDGIWSDPSRTPAQRVRAGYEAIRRGAGDGTFLLGCGAPLAQVVGVVDGNRIGPDVAPSWGLQPDALALPGYEATEPSTRNSWAATLARSFEHRRLWLNDPDCLMLRTDQTAMSAEAVRTWAHAVAVSGGMALVSDDLSLLGPDARALLDDVLVIGRAVDDSARSDHPPRCADLMDEALPTRLEAAGYELIADPDVPSSTLSRSRG